MKVNGKLIDSYFDRLYEELIKWPSMRYGQCVINVMYDYFPKAAKELTCTEFDCYYDDTKSTAFIQECFRKGCE